MPATGTLGLYPKFRADDLDGLPLEGGKLYSFLAGTSTPLALYHDAELTSAWTNPLILDASGEALFYYGPATYKLALHDANDVPLWVIDPVTGTGSGGASAGIGWGQYTVELRPATGTAQAVASVFPPDVLALGLTLWIAETFGTSQGLGQVGIGTADQPDRWGYLPTLSAGTTTTAGTFQGYGGQPQGPPAMVTLTAYGGRFDGTGAAYLTGHFLTLSPSQQLGSSYAPPSGLTVQPVPPASTGTAGLIELATQPEVNTGTDALRAVTPLTLQGRLAALPAASPSTAGVIELATQPEVDTGTDALRAVTPLTLATRLTTLPAPPAASETVAGSAELATTAEVTTGTDDLRIVTPLKLAQRIAAIPAPPAASDTTPGVVELATTAETTTGTDATRAVTPAGLAAKVPSGTGYTLPRYATGGAVLESSPAVVNASGYLGLGTAAPANALHIVGDTLQAAGITQDMYVNSGSGVTTAMRKARGTLAAPLRVLAGDTLLSLQANAWARDAADTTDLFFTAARLQIQVESADAQGRIGSRLALLLAPGVGQPVSEVLRVTQTGSLGLLTPCTATLGSGASFQVLNVKGSQLFVGQSSVQERAVGGMTASFVSSTDATRTGRLALTAYDATAAREGLRVEADGAAARLGFYGSAAVAKPTVTGSRGGNAALASVLTSLASLGLVTDSTTA